MFDLNSFTPSRLGLHDAVGYNLREGGELEAAEKEYRTALKLVDGEKEFAQALNQSPPPERVAACLAVCLLRQGKGKEATAECEAVIKRIAALIPEVKKDAPPEALVPAQIATLRLAQALAEIGDTLLWADCFAESVEWEDRALAEWAAYYQKWPLPPGTPDSTQRIHWAKAIALNWLDKGEEAVKAIDESIRRVEGGEKVKQQMMRARYVAKSGDQKEAANEARELLKTPYTGPDPQWYHWDAALAYSLCVRSTKDDELKKEYAAEAIRLLKKAMECGFDDLPLMKKDKDLDAIRDRAEFKAVLADLEKKLAPTKVVLPPPRPEK